jgi:hypothetical protein
MHVKTNADHDKHLTIHTVTGEPSFEESMAFFKQFYEGELTQNVLWDFTKASLARISSEHTETILDYVRQYVEKREGGKTAIIVSKDLEYGMSRMIITLAELKDIPFELEIFRSLEEAVQWIGIKDID